MSNGGGSGSVGGGRTIPQILKDDVDATHDCKNHYGASVMSKEVTKFVRNEVFPHCKFPPCDAFCNKLVLNTKEQFHVELPEGVTEEFFAAHWGKFLRKNITLCRHNAQTLGRKNFLGEFRTASSPETTALNKTFPSQSVCLSAIIRGQEQG